MYLVNMYAIHIILPTSDFNCNMHFYISFAKRKINGSY